MHPEKQLSASTLSRAWSFLAALDSIQMGVPPNAKALRIGFDEAFKGEVAV